MFFSALIIITSSPYGTAGLAYSAKTVKILEDPAAAIVIVSARPWETREKKLYIDIKNGYSNPDPLQNRRLQTEC